MKACESVAGVRRVTAPWTGPEEDEDGFSAGAGLLDDEALSPAQAAQGMREKEQWDK